MNVRVSMLIDHVNLMEWAVLVSPDAPAGSTPVAVFGLYARVSSRDQKSDLDRCGWRPRSG